MNADDDQPARRRIRWRSDQPLNAEPRPWIGAAFGAFGVVVLVVALVAALTLLADHAP